MVIFTHISKLFLTGISPGIRMILALALAEKTFTTSASNKDTEQAAS